MNVMSMMLPSSDVLRPPLTPFRCLLPHQRRPQDSLPMKQQLRVQRGGTPHWLLLLWTRCSCYLQGGGTATLTQLERIYQGCYR